MHSSCHIVAAGGLVLRIQKVILDLLSKESSVREVEVVAFFKVHPRFASSGYRVVTWTWLPSLKKVELRRRMANEIARNQFNSKCSLS